MAAPHQEAVVYMGLAGARGEDVQKVADFYGKYAPCQIMGQGEFDNCLRFAVIYTGPTCQNAAARCRHETNGMPWPMQPGVTIAYFDEPPPMMDKGKGKGGPPPMDMGKGAGKGGPPGGQHMPPRPRDPNSEVCVHIGNIDPATDVYVLRNLFSSYGEVMGFDVAPMVDRRGSSAVIEYRDPYAAAWAVASLNGYPLNPAWVLTVEHPHGQAPNFAPGGRFFQPPEVYYAKGKGKGVPDLNLPPPAEVFAGKGMGKGGPAPAPQFNTGPPTVVFLYNFAADTRVDEIRNFVTQRAGNPVEMRCYSQSAQENPNRATAGFAFLDMGSPDIAQRTIGEVNMQGQWKAELANPDIRRSKFPRLEQNGEEGVFEIRIMTRAGQQFSDEQIGAIVNPALGTFSPPIRLQHVVRNVEFGNIFYVRLHSIPEAHAVVREQDRIRNFDSGKIITEIRLVDPCLRPEALEGDTSAGGMPPAKRGRFGDAAGKTFRPPRNPREVVELTQQFRAMKTRGRPIPQDDWLHQAGRNTQNMLHALFGQALHQGIANLQGPQLDNAVRQMLSTQPDVMTFIKDDYVMRQMQDALENYRASLVPMNGGLADLMAQRNAMGAPPGANPNNPIGSPNLMAAPPPGTIWTGSLARNGGKKQLMHATILTGSINGFTLPDLWDIRHRSPLDEVSKRLCAAVIQLHCANDKAYNEYIQYFVKKQRAGLVNVDDANGAKMASLFIMPPSAYGTDMAKQSEDPTVKNIDYDKTILCILSPNPDHPLAVDLMNENKKEALEKKKKEAEAAANSPKKADGSPKAGENAAPGSPKKDGSPRSKSPKKDGSPTKSATKRKSPERSPKKTEGQDENAKGGENGLTNGTEKQPEDESSKGSVSV